jgi:hypothetical protein
MPKLRRSDRVPVARHCRDLTDPQLEGLVCEACWRHEHRRVRRLVAEGETPETFYSRLFFQSRGRPYFVTVTVLRQGRKQRIEYSNEDDPRIDPMIKLILPKVEQCAARLARFGVALRGACCLAKSRHRNYKDIDLRFRTRVALPFRYVLVELKWGSSERGGTRSVTPIDFNGRQSALEPLRSVAQQGGAWRGPHPPRGKSTRTTVVGGLKMCRTSWELCLYDMDTEDLLFKKRGRFRGAANANAADGEEDGEDEDEDDEEEEGEGGNGAHDDDESDDEPLSDASDCADLGDDAEFEDSDDCAEWRWPQVL